MLLLFNEPVSVVILVFLAIISVMMLTNFSFVDFMRKQKASYNEKQVVKKAAESMLESNDEDEEEPSILIDDLEEEKKESFFAKKFRSHGHKKNGNPVPGRKKRKVVEYAGNDRVIIDGMIFTKDIPSEDYDPISFREHLTGRGEMDDIAPSCDDGIDPDMELEADLYGSFIADPSETQVFTAEELNADPDITVFEEIVPEEDLKENTKIKENAAEPIEIVAELEDIVTDQPVVSHFSPPKTSILEKGKKVDQKLAAQNIREGVAKLEKTLESFGVRARVTEVSCGPSLIRYEVQPGPGVKVSKIVNLADDIALQLAAADVRMEAPIPGKSVIGIEVPRKDTVSVHFRDILENSRFFDMPSKLTCAYGQDIAGNPVIGDLAAMPHLLIAGTTGSGKSVCMNTMICSILFKATPDEVKFIMIDPKQVEFVIYEGLPHLITPVVTDPKKAAGALKWALREMENRYTLFNQNRVRNLAGYNALVEKESDRLPQIVIFIDELADLMMVAAKDVEASICRLAQKARAAGIHLVIATQRPSVDVITGLIKANIPSRIALSVSSQTDSRTILDVGGAEKLLGKGDMLYMPIGYSKPLRVQGAWLSDADAVAILDHYKRQGEPDYIEGVAQAVEVGAKKDAQFADELFFDAARAAITAGQASTSMMQRRFRIGYNHAARIMEELEEKGVIGPADGAKPRTVLMSLEVFKETFKEPEEQSLFDDLT
ncbi:MAG: DNA translocase FtsK [Firmicutes bacterium]|nr:DNA translocase FtsK [Bacillota bacterium]